MGNVFGKTKTVTQIIPSLEEEKKETETEKAKPKQRLLFTEGGNKGQKLNENQGSSIRKIFGN